MIPDLEANRPTAENNDLCTRFVRKKFQCIMVFLATLYLFLEVLKLSLDKFDKETFHLFVKNQTLFPIKY